MMIKYSIQQLSLGLTSFLSLREVSLFFRGFTLKNEERDEELERILSEKLREMMKRAQEGHEKPPSETDVKANISKPIEMTDATLTEIIRNNPLVVVDCWAPWCGPCHMIAPVIEEMARDYAGRILFGKLNIDENPRTAMEFQVMGIPTQLVFKDGRLVDRIVGAVPRQLLEAKIARHL
jgi:thioredoxin 1